MKLILFDVDGTLIDSQNIIVASMDKAFESLGLAPLSREKSLSIVGLSLPSAMAALVGPQGPVDQMVTAFKTAFTDLRTGAAGVSPFFTGMRELIEGLAQDERVMLGIATGKSRRGLNHLLEANGWNNLFSTTQTADDAASKPDPEMILRAMTETGTGPQDVVMIGDTTYDMAMAQGAGVHALGVSWGYHSSRALREQGVTAIVDDSKELAAKLNVFLEQGVVHG